MNDRLLMDEGMLSYSDVRELERATIAKTLKTVAEWGNAECWNGLHSEENIIAVRRIECPDCQDDLLEAAAKGKMPGEE